MEEVCVIRKVHASKDLKVKRRRMYSSERLAFFCFYACSQPKEYSSDAASHRQTRQSFSQSQQFALCTAISLF